MLLREVLVEVACSFGAHAQNSRHHEAASPLLKLAAGSASQNQGFTLVLHKNMGLSNSSKTAYYSHKDKNKDFTMTGERKSVLISSIIAIMPVQSCFIKFDNSLERKQRV